jgi:hypothetical protein
MTGSLFILGRSLALLLPSRKNICPVITALLFLGSSSCGQCPISSSL